MKLFLTVICTVSMLIGCSMTSTKLDGSIELNVIAVDLEKTMYQFSVKSQTMDVDRLVPHWSKEAGRFCNSNLYELITIEIVNRTSSPIKHTEDDRYIVTVTPSVVKGEIRC